MPLAALFIGGVLPVLLSRLIIERARLYEKIQFRMILISKGNIKRYERQASSNKLLDISYKII